MGLFFFLIGLFIHIEYIISPTTSLQHWASPFILSSNQDVKPSKALWAAQGMKDENTL